ncbi:hypothetical protein, partial [Trichothermofontia sp.]
MPQPRFASLQLAALWGILGWAGLAALLPWGRDAIAEVGQAQEMGNPAWVPTASPMTPLADPGGGVIVPTVPTFNNGQPPSVLPAPMGDGVSVPPTASDWLAPTPLPGPGGNPIAAPAVPAPASAAHSEAPCQLAPGQAVSVCPPL